MDGTKSIAELLDDLERGQISSVELAAWYLNRIACFDRTGPCLNSVPVLNPRLFEEARASDARRRRGGPARPLEGIPFTVKDSYMVDGLTVAAGSPAFASLVATKDAATVEQLRAAGAILIGKTNMPPMGAGGVQPGVYGFAKSPYNPAYLTAAYGSGSSNGAGTATAASFAAFGMAEETLSSGRSPASNNALVAYTPSRGLISIRGNWPLLPTRDVVVPYTRSVEDLLHILDVIVVEDPDTTGDFWRTQREVRLPSVADVRPRSFRDVRLETLTGVRIGVPRMFLGSDSDKRNPVVIRPSVRDLWDRAATDLTDLGAELILTDLPVISNYESDRPGAQDLVSRGYVDDDWESLERCDLVAAGWSEFLAGNGGQGVNQLASVDPEQVFPNAPASVYGRSNGGFDFARIIEIARSGPPAIDQRPQYRRALRGLEQARREDLEDWMTQSGLDAIAFPTNGDVAAAHLLSDPDAFADAHLNGVLFSNGNRAIRHLGIPTVTIPMGIMSDTGMPVGLTIAGAAYSDTLLVDIARIYDNAARRRVEPQLAVPITRTMSHGAASSERVTSQGPPDVGSGAELHVRAEIKVRTGGGWSVTVDVEAGPDPIDSTAIHAWLDGHPMDYGSFGRNGHRRFSANLETETPRIDPRALLVVIAKRPHDTLAEWKYLDLSA